MLFGGVNRRAPGTRGGRSQALSGAELLHRLPNNTLDLVLGRRPEENIPFSLHALGTRASVW